jgi:hypothetical protein
MHKAVWHGGDSAWPSLTSWWNTALEHIITPRVPCPVYHTSRCLMMPSMWRFPFSRLKHMLEVETTFPIAELTTLTVDTLFDKQCLDPSVQHLAAKITSNPRWGYDPRGILGTIHPSGEFEVHVPPSVAQYGPCVVIAATEDGADLGGGTGASNRDSSSSKHRAPARNPGLARRASPRAGR